MADTKITALAAITTVDPAADVLPIVDISDTSMAASGTTKKITSNQILGAGGTATLASATITGDLTVDTSTLKVDSANNRVGIGTATPGAGYSLDILGAAVGGIRVSSNNYPNLVIDSANSNGALIYIQEGGTTQARIGHLTAVTGLEFSGNNGTAATNVHYAIDSTGISTWKNVGGVAGTAMTLNSTGLGLGVTPTAQLSTYKSFQFGIGGNLIGRSNDAGIELSANSYRNTGGAYIYLNTDFAASYRQYSGQHQWFNAPSGTAGNAITFTQAMTLDASGNLLIGTTSLISGTPAGSLNIAGANSQQIVIRNTGAAAGDFWRQAVDSGNTFYVLNNASTGVSITSGATSWSAVSDERLKDIIEPISNAIAKVGSLRSVIGKYKNDETNTRRSFLIAQDVLSVLPEAVDSSKSNELGLRYSELIPLLVAAIKELTAEVNALKNA